MNLSVQTKVPRHPLTLSVWQRRSEANVILAEIVLIAEGADGKWLAIELVNGVGGLGRINPAELQGSWAFRGHSKFIPAPAPLPCNEVKLCVHGTAINTYCPFCES